MTEPDSFAIVGCGSMARRRIRHLLDFTAAKIFVFDVRDDRMHEVKDLFPSVICLETPDEIISNVVDALFICVPPSAHEFYIEMALSNALPFMCEQPISYRLSRLNDYSQKIKALGLTCHISNNQRYSPRVTTLRQILGNGSLGKVLSATVELGEWLPNWHPYEPYQDYYPSWRRLGGGLDAVCDLDWLRFLFGEPTRVASLHAKKSELEIDTFDVNHFIVDFGSDGPQVSLAIDMLQQPLARQSRFVCSGGVVVHTHPDQFHRVYTIEDQTWRDVPFGVDLSLFPSMPGKNQAFSEPMYQGDTLEFLQRLREMNSSLDSFENGVKNLTLVHQQVFPDA